MTKEHVVHQHIQLEHSAVLLYINVQNMMKQNTLSLTLNVMKNL